MTAKELLKGHKRKYDGMGFVSDLKTVEFTLSQFEAFCTQLCKEQREICAKKVAEFEDEVTGEFAINAPMPEI